MTRRRLLRVTSAIAGLVVPAYFTLMLMSSFPNYFGKLELNPWIESVLRFSLLSIPVVIWGSLLHLRQFARRIPDPTLVSSTGIVIVGLPVSIVGVILLPDNAADLFRILTYAGTAAFSLWTFVLIWIYRDLLRAPARAANRNARKRR